ncbi:hypothetical protein C8Q75DRAFT_760538 [Abortiporus biennis]|nr:hypothetical protein C8Q75DRAFT_760538 [Abortiporus biennis]
MWSKSPLMHNDSPSYPTYGLIHICCAMREHALFAFMFNTYSRVSSPYDVIWRHSAHNFSCIPARMTIIRISLCDIVSFTSKTRHFKHCNV